MINNHSKVAFFSIDVERFVDTECVHNTKQKIRTTMLDGLDHYLEILDKYNIKATLFVLSDLAEEIYDSLKKHVRNGHRIALHGKKHISPSLLTDEQFKKQIVFAKRKLEKLFNIEVMGYRAPCFGLSRERLDHIKEYGFKYDSSRIEFSLARHTTHIDVEDFENIFGEAYVKDGFFEFGVATERLFGKNYPVSGGGYLRLANWAFVGSLIDRYIKKHNYYVFYSHPFEFSKEKVPRVNNLKMYDRAYLAKGLSTYPFKLEYIIKRLIKSGYEFKTFEEIVEEYNK